MPHLNIETIRELIAKKVGRPRVDLTSINFERASDGTSLTSTVERLRLLYGSMEPSDPSTLIAKRPSPSAQMRALAGMFRLYEREVRFYETLAGRSSLQTPECYGASFDEADGDFLLVLEDIWSADVGDQVRGCTADQVVLAVREIASFHAGWWQHSELHSLDWMPEWDDPHFKEIVRHAFTQAWPVFLERYGRTISPKVVLVGERLPAAMDRILEQLSSPPITITHGDYRADNLLFAQSNNTPALTVIDWQLSCKGRGPIDIAYLMTQSVEPDLRRRLENDVLDNYLEAIGSGGVRSYNRGSCATDYRLAALYCLVYPVLICPGVIAGGLKEQETLDVIVERASAAIIDHNLHGLVA